MDSLNRSNGIPTRELGRTGERVTILGVGGHHIGRPDDKQLGMRIIRTAIDEGITFLDNAWCYHDGESERIMGRALQNGYRDGVFLMTKNHGRDAAGFRKGLEESLQRLQTDRIDLLQYHEVIAEGDPQRLLGQGAIEAAAKARDEGKVRYIGFTGHRWPHLFLQMLESDFPWDTVQMPVNLLDYHYRSFQREVMPLLLERGIGVIGMKSLASGRLVEIGIRPREAISFALSQPIATLVSGMESLDVLQQNLQIVRQWQPLSEEEQERLLARVEPHAQDGSLEAYKTE